MCDASGVVLGVVLSQRKTKFFHPVYYALKSLNVSQKNYAMTEQELLAVVYAFKYFEPTYWGLKLSFIQTMLLKIIDGHKGGEAKVD